jgi:type IV pilus assembly protein PilN
MYSIDINLLRERSGDPTGQQSEFINNTNITPTAKYGKVPLFIGAGVAALSLLAVGGSWLFLGQQTTQLEAKQKDLDQKLGSLKLQDARIAELNGQLAQVNDRTQSLASVFNQVQPWSAILQDLRESIPQGIQITKVTQTELKGVVATPATPAAPAPASGGLINKISTPPNPEASPKPGATPAATTPAATTPVVGTPAPIPATGATSVATSLPADVPTSKIEIVGTAKSFEEVNNFILTLKQSAFFNPDETQLLSAVLNKSATPLTTDRSSASSSQIVTPADKSAQEILTRLELPKIVEYKIQTSIKRVPAADLIRELEQKGAVGLVTRLRSIQQQQVTKP